MPAALREKQMQQTDEQLLVRPQSPVLRVLPAAIFGMLIVYCLKSVTLFAGSRGAPEAIALLVTVALHKWKHETLLSVAGGTLCYVLLVQLVF